MPTKVIGAQVIQILKNLVYQALSFIVWPTGWWFILPHAVRPHQDLKTLEKTLVHIQGKSIDRNFVKGSILEGAPSDSCLGLRGLDYEADLRKDTSSAAELVTDCT